VVAVSTKVRFNRLSREMIKRYVGTGEPMGKAGAYAIQSSGAVLIDRIYGDYNNVVGLPLSALTKILERMGAQRHGSTA
jgi:septum formation protein